MLGISALRIFYLLINLLSYPFQFFFEGKPAEKSNKNWSSCYDPGSLYLLERLVIRLIVAIGESLSR